MKHEWLILWEEAEHALRQIANLPGPWNEAHKIANDFFERHPATDPLRVVSIDLPGQPTPNAPSEAPSSAETPPPTLIVGSAGDPIENSGSSASPPILEVGSIQAAEEMQSFELKFSGVLLEVELKQAPLDQKKWAFVVEGDVVELHLINDAETKREVLFVHRIGAAFAGVERDGGTEKPLG